jgi:hypothetical protein
MIKHVWRGMALMLLLASAALAQPQVEKNVVFGMYSGAALLMDVYHPVQSNGLGLIVIQGSGGTCRSGTMPLRSRITRLSWRTAVASQRLDTPPLSSTTERFRGSGTRSNRGRAARRSIHPAQRWRVCH